MKWIKKGLIFEPDKTKWWQQHYGILPTPIYLEHLDIIRVYFATACKDKFGRITFIDLDANDPSKIVNPPETICLDIGEIGQFDDCGVNPSSINYIDNQWYLYYAGYQRHIRTPYSILSGLAFSNDGVNFKRLRNTPILERNNEEIDLRSAPTVIKKGDTYQMWYVSSLGWRKLKSDVYHDKLMPTYCIRHAESADGITWTRTDQPVISPIDSEFGFGRPYVLLEDETYYLFYSIRRVNQTYRIGFATSTNGFDWQRRDDEIGIDVSANGWDSEMICYPAVIRSKDKTLLFYNGNNNGETGFGFAELLKNADNSDL